MPRNNREWWQQKLNRNVARDREKDAELQALGWEVIHVWEHEDPVQAASLVRERWRARTT
jgi:DNA mismatch endonuclease (patch repair protein)